MKISIYQVGGERNAKMLFSALKNIEEFDCSAYDKVFSGKVDAETLEDVFCIFNTAHPKGYKGRSLSVSDVVEVLNDDGTSSFFFCDSFGFKEISFEREDR